MRIDSRIHAAKCRSFNYSHQKYYLLQSNLQIHLSALLDDWTSCAEHFKSDFTYFGGSLKLHKFTTVTQFPLFQLLEAVDSTCFYITYKIKYKINLRLCNSHRRFRQKINNITNLEMGLPKFRL